MWVGTGDLVDTCFDMESDQQQLVRTCLRNDSLIN